MFNYTLMMINQNILAIIRAFLNMQKKFMKNSTPSQLPQPVLLNFLAKFLTDRKYLTNTLIVVRQKYLQIFIKPINSEANNKSPGNDGLTAEFYNYFSNELTPVLLDVYNSWGKLGTIGVTSRTGISPIFYIKKVKNIYCKTIYPFQLRL